LYTEAQRQHPHPAAPSELQKTFSDFLKKFDASPSSLSNGGGKAGERGSKETFREFWEAPTRFWRPRVRELEDGEIDAILVC
jgi:small subunit ribosomal protein YMR-31